MTWKEKKQERMAQSAAMDVAVARHKKVKDRARMMEASLSPPLRSFSASTASSSCSTPVRHFPKEVDGEGNVEYKLRLINISGERLEQLRTQMKWRVEEGKGEALYRIGVMDDGEPVGLVREDLKQSLDTLSVIAKPLGFDTTVLEVTDGTFPNRKCAAVLVKLSATQIASRRAAVRRVAEEVRVAIVGAFGSGKSSVAAYLTRGIADDGCGKAGRCVAVHKHEIRHGRTSSFSSHAMPTPKQNRKQLSRFGTSTSSMTPASSSSFSSLTSAVIGCTEGVVMKGVENIFSDLELHHHEHQDDHANVPTKVVSLLDAGGHPKALTSCLRGLCASAPAYYMICLDAETAAGQHPDRLRIALDFVRIALQSETPFFVVLTKIDNVQVDVREDILARFAPGGSLLHVTPDSMDLAITSLRGTDFRVIPIVSVSSVTGSGMDILESLLNELPSKAGLNLDIMNEESDEDRNEEGTESGNMSAMGILRTYIIAADGASAIRDDGHDDGGESDDEGMEGLFGAADDSTVFTPSPKVSPSSMKRTNETKLIVMGVLRLGEFAVNQTVFVGPCQESGTFARAEITSMRCVSSAAVTAASCGTSVSMCLRFVDCDDGRAYARRGALVCSTPSALEKKLKQSFDVDIATGEGEMLPLRKNEEVIVLNGVIKQAARVETVTYKGDEAVGSFGTARVTLRFVTRAEYLLDEMVIIRKASAILVGRQHVL